MAFLMPLAFISSCIYRRATEITMIAKVRKRKAPFFSPTEGKDHQIGLLDESLHLESIRMTRNINRNKIMLEFIP